MSTVLTLPEINIKGDEVKLLLAIKLFEDNIVSLEKAAEIGNYSEKSFVEILIHRGIPPLKYSGLDLDKELKNA